MKRLMLLVLLLITLTGCTWHAWTKDFGRPGESYDKVALHTISIGDTKDQVVKALGDPARVVGGKQFTDAAVIVWEYEQWKAGGGPDRVDDGSARRHGSSAGPAHAGSHHVERAVLLDAPCSLRQRAGVD